MALAELEPRGRETRGERLALLGVALVSGAAALGYQAVWLQWFRVLFGSTAYAASATLCAFFAGLALGSELFGRLAGRAPRPLRAYARVELLAALLALLVPLALVLYEPLYAALYDGLRERRSGFLALKFLLALAAMLPSALLLGGTFPLLAAAFVRDPHRLGADGALLYAVNTLGAAAGSAAGLLWLPEVLGFRGTYAVAIALSLVAAAASWRLDRGAAPARSRIAAPVAGSARAPTPLLLVAFASGLGTLALEVLVIQAVAQVLDHSVYSLGSVLVVVLLALAAGAAIASAASRRIDAVGLLGAALALEALLLLLLPGLVEGEMRLARERSLVAGLVVAARLGGPPLLVGALVLPLTFQLAAGGSVGRRVGGLLAANTAGAIIGSVGASFVLLDRVGLWGGLGLLGLGYGLAWLLVPGTPLRRGLRGVAVAGFAATLAAGPAAPLRLPRVALAPQERVLELAEGAYGVVSVLEGPNGRRMKLNNHYTLSGAGPLHLRKERQGHLPLLLHPSPRRVLFLGSATGGTAGAAVLHPPEEIVLVELVPQVQALAARHFADTNRRVYQDPRTRVVVEDARNHLRASRERYDVIVADLFRAARPGVGSLYTREHFEAVRSRLTPGGLFCQWLPVYEYDSELFELVAGTFLDVFDAATVWRSSFYRRLPVIALVGFSGAPPSEAQVERRVSALAASGAGERWLADRDGFWLFYLGPLSALAPRLADTPRNRDDRPAFEFRAGRTRAVESRAFVSLEWPRIERRLRSAAADATPPFGARAAAGARAGALLDRANALFLADRPDESSAALAALRDLLPEHLLATPDATMAEMWNLRHLRSPGSGAGVGEPHGTDRR